MTLAPEEIELIAQRVAALITDRLPAPPQPRERLVDAAELARLLHVERDWVYAHANQLGGVRLGGPKGRLRFDLAQVTERLDRTTDPPTRPGRVRSRRPERPGHGRPTTPAPNHLHSPRDRPTTTWPGGRANAPRP